MELTNWQFDKRQFLLFCAAYMNLSIMQVNNPILMIRTANHENVAFLTFTYVFNPVSFSSTPLPKSLLQHQSFRQHPGYRQAYRSPIQGQRIPRRLIHHFHFSCFPHLCLFNFFQLIQLVIYIYEQTTN